MSIKTVILFLCCLLTYIAVLVGFYVMIDSGYKAFAQSKSIGSSTISLTIPAKVEVTPQPNGTPIVTNFEAQVTKKVQGNTVIYIVEPKL